MRSKGELEGKIGGCFIKDPSLGLLRMLYVLISFVLGVVVGLISSSHIEQYFSSHTEAIYTNHAFVALGGTFDRCEVEDCLSMESFLRPKYAMHGMSDEELFWRASMVPQMAEYPYKKVPKVAFMFLTRGPLPLMPLWERFFHGQSEKQFSIYVHALPGYELNVTNTSVFHRRQISSKNVEWGSVSLADAERRLLANALLDFSNERFVLLSESCIPVYNFQTVYEYLIGSVHNFVESYDDPGPYGRGRYSRHMQPHIMLSDWRKGSQWFELNRTLAIKIVSDTKYYTIFRKYCTPDCYPDEHYIPTYIHMFYGPLNANRTVTYVDWSTWGPHPATFGEAKITKDFIQSIRINKTQCMYNFKNTTICYLFARKFAPDALAPLLNLSSTLMGF
ncbi:hypothetical protein RJ639_038776 [Escallonia herrerae]|uniref:Core-2/I-branching beta-1,6-N-acetylglucosaminyltransferase family protein n=1 Tax=Escallonia herrerae TaxID=1293975 RepID=A0AA89BFD9_9ASTE|nr:hypothetical protein RJ639_038776 [Escallonia herrerae]